LIVGRAITGIQAFKQEMPMTLEEKMVANA
jgi:hypothetical protein